MLEILDACMKVLEVKGVITSEEYNRIVKTLKENQPIVFGLTDMVANCLDEKTKE